jgi:dihydroneopterin aldolase
VTDVVEVRGLRCLAVCGAFDDERTRPQPLVIDLDVELDAEVAAATDELSDTVNYATLCDLAVSALVAAKPRLLEHASDVVARAVLGADPRVLAVSATVAKLRPPIPHDAASVGVRRRVTR